MKKIVWAAVLVCSLQVCVARSMWAAPKTDAADYNVAVHVSGSHYDTNPLFQVLSVVIDGKHYELAGPTSSAKAFMHGNGLLNPGDYKAKLTEDTHKTAFESIQVYEFLLPDGTQRKFSVILQSE